MKFFMPTKLYLEFNAVKTHGEELAALGTRAFIVTGKSSAKNGSLNDVTDVLDKYGVKYEIFNDTEQNPSVEQIMLMRERAVSFGADFVIGIGGGSPLDAAKAAALMAANPDKGAELLYQKCDAKYLPVAEVPTTAGTGSEVTQYSILTLHDTHTKKSISHAVFPTLALDDPMYLLSLPKKIIIDTATDTLAHLLESWLSVNHENSVLVTEKGLELWGECKEDIRNGKLNELSAWKLMAASAAGGIAIAQTSTSIPHGMSYKVTYELGIAHGRACGMYLGGYVDTYPDKKLAEMALKHLGFDNTLQFKEFLADLLDEKPLDKAFALENAREFLKNKDKLKNHAFEVDEEKLLEMENMYIK